MGLFKQATPLQEIERTLRRSSDRLASDSKDRADECESKADKLDALADKLAVWATVLAGIATATALPGGITNWVAAAAALLATIVSGVSARKKPHEKAKDLRIRGAEWRAVQTKGQRLARNVRIALADETDPAITRDELMAIASELEQLETQRDRLVLKIAGAPALPE